MEPCCHLTMPAWEQDWFEPQPQMGFLEVQRSSNAAVDRDIAGGVVSSARRTSSASKQSSN
jgi:hypothetical protein